MLSRPGSPGTLTDMPVDTHDSTFRDALSQLQGGAHSLRWSYRRELALALGEVFAGGIATDAALALVHQLAGDPKWEVRHAVAELLANLPPDDFEQLVGRLAGDANHYVRRAAQQALQRQRSDRRAIGCQRRSADQLNQHLQAIEAEHGKAAANQALRLCERYSELLVGSMVHDLRSIVTHLKTNCHSLIDASGGGKPQRLGGRVHSDLQLLEKAIDDMHTFAQPLSGERHSAQLAAVVAEALEMARNNLRKIDLDPAGVSVELNVAESIVVEIARHQIMMALANVLKNAFEACLVPHGRPGEKRIEISAACCGNRVTIVVRDNGQGMSREEARVPLLFAPGRRNKTKKQSTGYGLPIAARNFAAHGGTLSIESQEDVGTAVTMSLPLVSS